MTVPINTVRPRKRCGGCFTSFEMDIIISKVFLLYRSSSCETWVLKFSYTLIFLSTFILSSFELFPPQQVIKKQQQPNRQDTFSKRLVEEGNERSVYLRLAQFPDKIESFVCFRLNSAVIYIKGEQ